MAQQRRTEQAGSDAQGGEDDGEAGDEGHSRAQGQRPRLRASQLADGKGRDVGQVAGDERQTARGAERDGAGDHGTERQEQEAHLRPSVVAPAAEDEPEPRFRVLRNPVAAVVDDLRTEVLDRVLAAAPA